MQLEVIVADYSDQKHAHDIGYLLNQYAMDPMGMGKPLTQEVKDGIAHELSKLPHAFSILCYADGEPAGLANCFDGFSTFSGKPIVNIHDFMVEKKFRGKGISQKILAKIEGIAKHKGCCKLTLEVLEGNTIARSVYNKFGFSGYELDPKTGRALFWQKVLCHDT